MGQNSYPPSTKDSIRIVGKENPVDDSNKIVKVDMDGRIYIHNHIEVIVILNVGESVII